MRVRAYTGWLSFALALGCVTHAAPAAAKRPGTHFLAELDGGVLLSGSGGPAARVAVGAGAKFTNFPARFYLLGSFSASAYEAAAARSVSPWPGSEEGNFDDFALGPRVYLPIVGPLRFFAEGLFGATLAYGTYTEQGLAPLHAYEWLALAQVAVGLQWRLLYELSLGVRAGLAFNQAGLTGVARVAGVHDEARPTLTAGVTWHF